MALSVALLGVTGCGGSSGAPSASAPADPAASSAPSTGGSANAPVSTGGGGTGSGDNIARDIAAEHDAATASLRVWGKKANAVCRKANSRYTATTKRLKAMVPKGRKFTRGEQERFGREFLAYARRGEDDFAAIRAIALPKEAEALERIHSFFDKIEESLTLAQRFGIEVAEYHSLPDMLAAIQRSHRLSDDFKRDARAVKAPACARDA